MGIESCWTSDLLPTSSVCLKHGWTVAGDCSNHVGCFKDTAGLTEKPWVKDDLSVSLCRDYCLYHGYEYAAMRKGRLCTCGTDFVMTEKATGQCNVKCSGMASEMCGGDNTMSVHTTGYYQGCYKDKKAMPDLEHLASADAAVMSVRDCRQYCRGENDGPFYAFNSERFRYAGLKTQNGTVVCRCGMSFGKYGTAAADKNKDGRMGSSETVSPWDVSLMLLN